MSEGNKVHWSNKEDPFKIPIHKPERSTSSPDKDHQINHGNTPPKTESETLSSAMSLRPTSPEGTPTMTNGNQALVLSKVEPSPQFGMEGLHKTDSNSGLPNAENNFANHTGAVQPYYHYQPSPPPYYHFLANPVHNSTVGGYGYPAITSQPTRPMQSSYANAASHAASTDSSDDEDQSSLNRSKPSKPATRHTSNPKHTSSIVKSIDELDALGKWEILDKQDEMQKIIEKYVYNSNGVKKSEGTVKIRQIFHLKKKWSLPSIGTNYQMMLWWKTSPEGVKRLALKRDGCIAFYDRIGRAFSVKPGELKKPFHQIILLCTVTLGDKLNHSQGYKYWNTKVLSHLYNSVKGTGRYKPIWGENEVRKSVIIPCGKTEVDRRQQKSELEYNEYMVFEADRIKIKYAVEVEIIPKSKGPTSNSDVD